MLEDATATQLQIPFERNLCEGTNQICVGIVSSHSLAAHYLIELLKVYTNILPVILSDGVNSAKVFPASTPVVILIDLWGLALPMFEYLDAFAGAIPGCTFLAVDRARKESDLAQFLRTGFAGFISHDEVSHLLGPAIQAVAEGRVWISPEVISMYMRLTSQRNTMPRVGVDTLTVRENQILDLLRRRCSNKEVADLLGISESTVKFHVSNVLMKLNVNNRRDLTDKESFFGARSLVHRESEKKQMVTSRSGIKRPERISQPA